MTFPINSQIFNETTKLKVLAIARRCFILEDRTEAQPTVDKQIVLFLVNSLAPSVVIAVFFVSSPTVHSKIRYSNDERHITYMALRSLKRIGEVLVRTMTCYH